MMYVFVYGSLKKGYYNHHFLDKSKFIKKAYLKNYTLYYDYNKKYPSLYDVDNGYLVSGEIYEINYDILNELDILEEVGILYKRVNVNISDYNCYLYVSLKKEDNLVAVKNNIQEW